MSEHVEQRFPVLEATDEGSQYSCDGGDNGHDNVRDTPDTEAVLDNVRSLPWVAGVFETDREDASHYVEATIGVLDVDREFHELANLGVSVEAVSLSTERVYVSVRNSHRGRGN